MVKRKCGTCRHFKDGGIAGSGWCHHPARRELHHMVLVRKTELGCRNNWDQDLWEPSTGLTGESDASGSRVPDPTPPIPARPGEFPLSAPQAAGASAEIFTDKLTSITMAAPRETPSSDAGVESGSAESVTERSDVRAARRRRIEQLERERQEKQRDRSDAARRLVEQAPDASGSPSTEDAGKPPRSRAVLPDWAEPRENEPPAPRPVVQHRSSERERSPSPGPGQGPRLRTTGGAAFRDELLSFGASPSSFRSEHATERGAPPTIRLRERPIEPAPPPRPAFVEETDDLPVEEVRAQLRERPAPPALVASTPPARPQQPGPSQGESAVKPPIDERDPGWHVWAGQIGGPAPATTRAAVRSTPEIDQPDSLPMPLPDVPSVVRSRPTTIPESCATCRDFRPVGDGRTGWCANEHAFPTKRMVESSDLACRSSLGCWWLPSDDVWLDGADTTHHSRPTPLLDELRKATVEREREVPSHPS